MESGERTRPLNMAFEAEDLSAAALPPIDPAAAAAARPRPETPIAAVLQSLEDSKAEDIVPIDIMGKTSLADYMVVASGRSHRHVGAIADHLLKDLKEAGFGTPRVEGLPQCDWVLIDAGDVIVHVFRPEVRLFYNLEKMWSSDTPAAPARANG